MLAGPELVGPLAVKGDGDEHEALGVEGRPAGEESNHHSHCNNKKAGAEINLSNNCNKNNNSR